MFIINVLIIDGFIPVFSILVIRFNICCNVVKTALETSHSFSISKTTHSGRWACQKVILVLIIYRLTKTCLLPLQHLSICKRTSTFHSSQNSVTKLFSHFDIDTSRHIFIVSANSELEIILYWDYTTIVLFNGKKIICEHIKATSSPYHPSLKHETDASRSRVAVSNARWGRCILNTVITESSRLVSLGQILLHLQTSIIPLQSSREAHKEILFKTPLLCWLMLRRHVSLHQEKSARLTGVNSLINIY